MCFFSLKSNKTIKSIALISLFVSEQEDRSNPRGIVPIWRARSVTIYDPDLLPPEPIPLPVKDSLDSLIDIIDYLQQQYGKDMTLGGEEGVEEMPQLPILSAFEEPPFTDTMDV